MSFVHLHVHSEYSLLDGLSNIKKLVGRAKEMGMPAVALTDHGTMFGAIDFYKAATEAGVKPIIGVESYLAPRGMSSRDPQLDKKSTHILLLAENQTGYQNLLRVASAAQLDGFYYYPRIDHELLAQHNEGLICTSGCMSAEVPRLIQQGDMEGARKQLDWYYDVFGKDRFFLELQQHDIKELDNINKMLIDLGRRYDARFVATNDVHYINKEDARLQDILLAIQTGCLLSDPNRMRMTDSTYYLRSPEEMSHLFSEVPGAIENTLLIAERCSVDLGFKGYRLPNFPVPDGQTAETYLRHLCEDGLRRRYGARAHDPLVRQRLDYELGVIHTMGFDAYFLIVWDLCNYARQQGIWYNARGSAAGSIVAYTLDITLVDPIEHGLIFERFLNPGRISMPDIDLDFRDDRRAEMLEYTARKYGDDKVAQIITFGTLGARAAIRDVGRVMDIPLSEVDKVAKLIPNIPGKPVTISQALEEVTEFKQAYQSAPVMKELIETASKMEGVVRNAGTHAAGVIITDKPIIEYIPLHRPTGSNQESPIKTVTQFEMSVVDSLGLLKVDFLGLATLTIMARACDLIYQRHGIRFDLNNIPTDDPATYELLGRGETAGVFQVEGSGMRRWLVQMKPKELANVIAMVALFRPGPMDFIPGYIRRMHGEEEVEYRHPMLEPIFRETYGYPVYQEQLMFAAINLAGYTASEADDLRKAIAKKIKEKLHKHRQKFIDGSKKNDIPEEVAGAIFDDWEEFARYGFNKSHAVDYGVIAVQTGYLKAHYPVEYMTAVLSVTKNETDKVALYVADSRRMGIEVGAPDINASEWDFSIEDRPGPDGKTTPVIRFGLGAVKNVGQGPVEAILKARQEKQFTDLNDFARRVDLRHVGKRALESLVKVGALDSFGPRPAMMESLDRIMSVSASHFKAAEVGQMSLFGAHTGLEEQITLPKASGEISRRDQLNWERELIGLYVSDHPLNPIMHMLNDVVTHFSGQLSDVSPADKIRVAGIISRVRHHQSKAGKPMAFATLEDLQGTVDLVIFPRTWEKVSRIVEVDRIVLVDGRVDNAGGEPKILVDTITSEFKYITSLNPPSPPAVMPDPLLEGEEDADGQAPTPPPVDSPLELQRTFPSYEARPPRKKVHEADLFVENLGDESGSWEAGEILPPEPPPDWSIPEPPPDDARGRRRPSLRPGDQPSAARPAAQSAPRVQPVQAAPPPAEETAAETASLVSLTTTPVAGSGRSVETEDSPAPEGVAMTDAGETIEPAGEAASYEINLPEPGEMDADLPEPAPAATPLPGASQSPNRLASLPKPPPFLVSPTPLLLTDGAIHMIKITLRSTGDKTRDVLRLRRLHGIIISYPGEDRFSFQVYEQGRGYLLEFPNFTTGLCQDLLNRLSSLVGPDSIRVEQITFQ